MIDLLMKFLMWLIAAVMASGLLGPLVGCITIDKEAVVALTETVKAAGQVEAQNPALRLDVYWAGVTTRLTLENVHVKGTAENR